MSWWLLDDIALMAAALIIMINFLLHGWLSYHEPEPTNPSYTPKLSPMPKTNGSKPISSYSMIPQTIGQANGRRQQKGQDQDDQGIH